MSNQLNTSQLLPIGTILNNTYRIETYLASGGFGNTYLVTDIKQVKCFAIKEFFYRDICNRDRNRKSVSITKTSDKELYTELRNKFKKEASLLMKLHNEHIVKVHKFFEENNTSYYVMDFINGQSLDSVLESGAIEETKVIDYMYQIFEALKPIHKKNVFHLDIKPANIMLDYKDDVILIDFGSSKNIDNSGNLTTNSRTGFCVTRSFSPIELSSPADDYSNIGPWTDIYELGATLYNLLTNYTPPTSDEIMTKGKSAFHFPTRITNATRDLIIQMMKPNRNDRPQNINEVRGIYQRFAGVEVVEVLHREGIASKIIDTPDSRSSYNSSSADDEYVYCDEEEGTNRYSKFCDKYEEWIAALISILSLLVASFFLVSTCTN